MKFKFEYSTGVQFVHDLCLNSVLAFTWLWSSPVKSFIAKSIDIRHRLLIEVVMDLQIWEKGCV